MHFPQGQHYDCLSCGRCCQGWRIPVEPEKARALAEDPLLQGLPAAPQGVVERWQDGSWIMQHTPEHACCCLTSEKLCRIHSLRSPLHKPRPCQQFPFLFTETPAGTFVGVNFFCTAVHQNHGRTLPEQADELQQLLDRGARRERVGEGPIPVRPGITCDWQDYLAFEARLKDHWDFPAAFWAAATCISDGLTAAWSQPAPLLLEWLELITFSSLKFALFEDDVAKVSACDQAYFSAGPLPLEEYGWQGTWVELNQVSLPEAWEADLIRWQELELHRKALLIEHDLLDNLWGLFLAPRLARNLARLLGQQRGLADPPQVWTAALHQATLQLGPSSLHKHRYFAGYTQLLRQSLGPQNINES